MNKTKESDFVLKGNIIYANLDGSITCMENAYLVCVDHKVEGVFAKLPVTHFNLKLTDMGDRIIIPGMTDLHVHAPQYTFRGLGMDLELLEWLNKNTFPEEEKYEELSYARKAYEIFVHDLKFSVTTRACIFATIHNVATMCLSELLEESGLNTYVGRVNMDRNCSEKLCEESAARSAVETEAWICEVNQKFKNTKPIITPRFIPSCTDELMQKLSHLQQKYQLPVQSHLSENLSEIDLVKELIPSASNYGAAYNSFGLFGGEVPTIMAHCVYSSQEEIELMKRQGVYIAHCPESNLNIASGIAPIRKYRKLGLNIGLGTDVAGGSSLSMLKAMAYTVQASKMYWRLIDQEMEPLNFEDAFYLSTLGGGSFFGKVGSFLQGYEFDAVVIEDRSVQSLRRMNIKERVERLMYLPESVNVFGKYVKGLKII